MSFSTALDVIGQSLCLKTLEEVGRDFDRVFDNVKHQHVDSNYFCLEKMQETSRQKIRIENWTK